MFDFGDEGSRDELEAESKRLIEHLSFLRSLARMWAVAADIAVTDQSHDDLQDRRDSLTSWANRTRENRIGLLELLDAVRGYKVPMAGSDKESMRSYDRHRVLRDSLMEQIIGAAVEMSDARRLICGAILALPSDDGRDQPCEIALTEEMAEDDERAVRMFGASDCRGLRGSPGNVSPLVEAIRSKNLLYIPLSRGGDPVKIYVARSQAACLAAPDALACPVVV